MASNKRERAMIDLSSPKVRVLYESARDILGTKGKYPEKSTTLIESLEFVKEIQEEAMTHYKGMSLAKKKIMLKLMLQDPRMTEFISLSIHKKELFS